MTGIRNISYRWPNRYGLRYGIDILALIPGKGWPLHSNNSFPIKEGFGIDLPLLKDACVSKHRFSWFDLLIWTFMLWFYFGKSLFSFSFFKCVEDYNKPKPTEVREGFVGIVSRTRWQGQTWVPMFPMDDIPNIQKRLDRSTQGIRVSSLQRCLRWLTPCLAYILEMKIF